MCKFFIFSSDILLKYSCLSDTRPEQKEPRANPVKRSILARVLSQLFSQTRSHSVTMVDTQKLRREYKDQYGPIRGEYYLWSNS